MVPEIARALRDCYLEESGNLYDSCRPLIDAVSLHTTMLYHLWQSFFDAYGLDIRGGSQRWIGRFRAYQAVGIAAFGSCWEALASLSRYVGRAIEFASQPSNLLSLFRRGVGNPNSIAGFRFRLVFETRFRWNPNQGDGVAGDSLPPAGAQSWESPTCELKAVSVETKLGASESPWWMFPGTLVGTIHSFLVLDKDWQFCSEFVHRFSHIIVVPATDARNSSETEEEKTNSADTAEESNAPPVPVSQSPIIVAQSSMQAHLRSTEDGPERSTLAERSDPIPCSTVVAAAIGSDTIQARIQPNDPIGGEHLDSTDRNVSDSQLTERTLGVTKSIIDAKESRKTTTSLVAERDRDYERKIEKSRGVPQRAKNAPRNSPLRGIQSSRGPISKMTISELLQVDLDPEIETPNFPRSQDPVGRRNSPLRGIQSSQGPISKKTISQLLQVDLDLEIETPNFPRTQDPVGRRSSISRTDETDPDALDPSQVLLATLVSKIPSPVRVSRNNQKNLERGLLLSREPESDLNFGTPYPFQVPLFSVVSKSTVPDQIPCTDFTRMVTSSIWSSPKNAGTVHGDSSLSLSTDGSQPSRLQISPVQRPNLLNRASFGQSDSSKEIFRGVFPFLDSKFSGDPRMNPIRNDTMLSADRGAGAYKEAEGTTRRRSRDEKDTIETGPPPGFLRKKNLKWEEEFASLRQQKKMKKQGVAAPPGFGFMGRPPHDKQAIKSVRRQRLKPTRNKHWMKRRRIRSINGRIIDAIPEATPVNLGSPSHNERARKFQRMFNEEKAADTTEKRL